MQSLKKLNHPNVIKLKEVRCYDTATSGEMKTDEGSLCARVSGHSRE